MKVILVLEICALVQAVCSANVTDHKVLNKKKRGLPEQTNGYGEQSGLKPVSIYHEPVAAAASSGLSSYYSHTPKTLLFPSPPLNAVFEPETPKQVTAQQVLYEYQQTPHNAVSNVHVNQQFQTLPEYSHHLETAEGRGSPEMAHTQRVYSSQPPPAVNTPNQHYVNNNQQHQNLRTEPNQYSVGSESVVLPVHHSTFVHHAPPITHYYQLQSPNHQPVVTNPTAQIPAHIQVQQQQHQHQQQQQQQQPQSQQHQQPYGKYIYLNGKIVYHPLHPQSALYQQQQTLYPGLQVKHPALSYTNQNHYPNQQQHNRQPPPPPKQQQFFHAAPVKYINNNQRKPPVVTTTLLPPSPPKYEIRENEEEREEKANAREEETEEEEEEEAPSHYEAEEEKEEEEEEEEDKKPYRFYNAKFFDDEEEDDNEKNQKEEEEDEDEGETDNKRGSSKKIVHKPYSKKYYKNDSKPYSRYHNVDHFKHRDDYHGSKSKKPHFYHDRETQASTNVAKKQKASKPKGSKEPTTQYKAFKYVKASKAKPKADTLEGRQSQNVPVIHSHKLYREKWYVSKT